MCVIVQKKSVPLMLLTAYRVAELLVNMLKDSIETDCKEMELMTRRLNLIWLCIIVRSPFSATIYVEI